MKANEEKSRIRMHTKTLWISRTLFDYCGMQVYGDFEDLETGEKRTGEEGKDAEGEGEEEEAPRIVDYGGDAAREKGGHHSGPFRILSNSYTTVL